MTQMTMSSKNVCPRMADFFNLLTGNINTEDPIDAVAIVALARVVADNSLLDIDSLWEQSEVFADRFVEAVERKYGK